jgi:serine/threonine protein kinase/tetratricopeptide (TPR) repeat protein
MGLDDSTEGDSRPTRPNDPLILARDRFLDELRAGSSPRIEDYLDGQDVANRAVLLRELLVAERDWRRGLGLEVDPSTYRAQFPTEAGRVDEVFVEGEPTTTLSRRDRGETEACLLFGLLAMANGLIEPEILTRSLGAWSRSAGHPLREVLVKRGHLDESDASMIDALAAKHLEQHHGIAWESLIALSRAVRFRLDPGEVADSELRCILAGFVEGPAEPPPSGADGFGPRYEIVKPHARGGLGVVSLARDREMHREVAVKEIRDDCAHNPDYRARFLREAEVTGRLEHPGIVPVYGIGYHDDGRPFYIMRFIRGETLKVAISRLHKPQGLVEEPGAGDRSDLHSLVGRFIDACHAVAYAHHRKILHRDIKPINIMLGPFGETLVVDWGLAKTFDGPRSDEYPSPIEEGTLKPESGSGMTPTRYGSEIGTIGYMSPEQAAGRLIELGPPSDLYSLGVTLHYLATGHPPFEGATKEEFLRRVREGDFPRPRAVNPEVPPALEAICLKAMALRPVDRYQSVGELIDDLECWRAGQPVHAYPEPPLDRLARWGKKHKTALAGAAVLLICTTIGLAGFALQKRRENSRLVAANAAIRAAEARAQTEGDSAREELGTTRASLRMILIGLSGPGLTYLANSGPPRLKLANEALGRYRELVAKHPDDEGVQSELAHALWVTANIGRSMGEFDPARLRYEEAIRRLEAILVKEPRSDEIRLRLAAARIDLGEHLRMAGRPREAEPCYLAAIAFLERPGLHVDDENFNRIEAHALIDLAASRIETGRPLEARPNATKAVEILGSLAGKPKAKDKDRLLFIYALNTRSTARMDAGEVEEARADLSNALERARKLRGESDEIENTDFRYALAMTENEFGRFLIKAGEPAEALKRYDAAFAILANLWLQNLRLPFMEGDLATALNGRAGARLALLSSHPDPKALELARKDAVKARSNLEGLVTRFPTNYIFLGKLGQTLANLGRLARAEGDTKAAGEFLDLALKYHRQAGEANPESPDDRSSAERLIAEVEAIRATRPRSPSH